MRDTDCGYLASILLVSQQLFQQIHCFSPAFRYFAKVRFAGFVIIFYPTCIFKALVICVSTHNLNQAISQYLQMTHHKKTSQCREKYRTHTREISPWDQSNTHQTKLVFVCSLNTPLSPQIPGGEWPSLPAVVTFGHSSGDGLSEALSDSPAGPVFPDILPLFCIRVVV